MKKLWIPIFLLALTLPGISQGRKYQKAMVKGLEKNAEAQGSAFLESAAHFHEIADDHPGQWMPLYYQAQSLILGSFEIPGAAKKDSILAVSEQVLKKALELAPEESELHVMNAFYFIGKMSVDPMVRGQVFYQDALWAIEKALELNPENPRAAYLNAMMILNMPDFMGGGPEAAKPHFTDAKQKFQAFRNEDPLWPSWGEELVDQELSRLK